MKECKLTKGVLITSVFLTLFALPFHSLVIKVLYKVCKMTQPRHKIMMSLTISDALQIFTSALIVIFLQIFSATQYQKVVCRYTQTVGIFFFIVTLFVLRVAECCSVTECCRMSQSVAECRRVSQSVEDCRRDRKFSISVTWVADMGIGGL